MNIIKEWMSSILFILLFVQLVVGNIIRFYYWFKCRKVKKWDCKNTECRYRQCCKKWVAPLTEKEIAKFYVLVEHLKESALF